MIGELSWLDDPVVSRGVVERCFDVDSEGRTVPGLLWTPEAASGERPLVLLGHGGSLHKRSDYILGMARRLVRHHGFAAAAIDGPVHGDRRPDGGLDSKSVSEDFRKAWDTEGSSDRMVADWQASLDALRAQPDVGEGAVGYWGLSMGTIFGLPFVAAESRVQVAVLGLMGIMGPSGRRMADDAPKLACPVLFLQQWDDELVPRERVVALFDAIGSRDKRLHANPGAHSAVPPEEVRASEEFLAQHLRSGR
ncbi:MAG: dienelactone hydrolase family protein [Proteobacteria bacterium]|nr:dienelactone hydrolase family protein [Pseudomonadota bacterium]